MFLALSLALSGGEWGEAGSGGESGVKEAKIQECSDPSKTIPRPTSPPFRESLPADPLQHMHTSHKKMRL